MQTPKSDLLWQTAMRPLMIAMLVGTTIFFFAATLFQVARLNDRIATGPTLDTSSLTTLAPCPAMRGDVACAADRRMAIAVALEAHVIALRHHEAGVLLMAALWSRYVGFITGMTLALVGGAFILGKLSDSGTNLDAGSDAAFKLTVATASPGIVMVVAGVVLMTLTITTLQQFSTRDSAIYFNGEGGSPPAAIPNIYMEPGAAASPSATPLPNILKGTEK